MAQDLASYGRDRSRPGERVKAGRSPIAALTRAISARVERTRLLYLYPSGLTDELIEAVSAPACPTSTCPSSTCPARCWPACAAGATASASCAASPTSGRPTTRPPSAPRSSWATPARPSATTTCCSSSWPRPSSTGPGFFTFSNEAGTHAADLPDQVPAELALERLRECTELQDAITAARRDLLVGQRRQVLVDAPGRGRTVHEAPEIDGVVHLPADTVAGELLECDGHRRRGPRPATR